MRTVKMPESAQSTTTPAPSNPAPRLPRRVLDWIVGGSHARWLFVSFALSVVLPWFFSCPIFPPNPEGRETRTRYWQGVVQRKIDHPLYDYAREFPPESNEAKRNFRLLVPLVARELNLGFMGVHVARFSLQAALILAVLIAAERACRDRASALGVALAISGTHIGTQVWRDPFYNFDNCAHAFIALALVARGPRLAGLAVLLGLFVDERVLCSVPLIALFGWLTERNWRTAPGLLVGAMIYFAVRVSVSARFGLQNPLSGVAVTQVLLPNLANIPPAFWFALEGGWLLLFLAAKNARVAQKEIVALWIFVFLLLIASGLVGDFTRSTMYGFPATLVALAALAGPERLSLVRLRATTAAAAAVSLLVPNAIVIWDNVSFESSMPVRILQAWLRSL